MKHMGTFLRLAVVFMVLLTIAWAIVMLGAAFAPIAEATPIRMPEGLPWGMLIANDVNFRTGPGTEYKSLFQWSYGHCVEIIREVDGWYECYCWISECPCWVKAEYIQVQP